MLAGCGGNRWPGGMQWQPTAGFMASVTCGLTPEDWDKLRNSTLPLAALQEHFPLVDQSRGHDEQHCVNRINNDLSKSRPSNQDEDRASNNIA